MQGSTQDDNFPKTTIGRPQHEVPSHDPLTTHPLLSSIPSEHAGSHSATPHLPPRYVPYTPRQRVTTPSASASPAIVVSSLPPSHAGAAGKPQLQGIKAALQVVDLVSGTIGWNILEKLVSGEDGPEWDEIWGIISRGQTTLLLPTEPAPDDLIVTPEFVRDHVAFCNVPLKDSSPLVTLGGLRGSVDLRKVIITSALSTSSKEFSAIQNPASRGSVLTSLPPLARGSDENLPYPTFEHTSYIPSLSLPHRPNPFASLFAPRTSLPTPSTVPVAYPPRPSSPQPPSIRSEATADTSGYQGPRSSANDGHTVAVVAIDRKILRKDVGRAVTAALKAQIQSELVGLPSWLPDRIMNFTAPFQPFSTSSNLTRALPDSTGSNPPSTDDPATQVANITSAQATSDSFQGFYEALEETLSTSTTLTEKPSVPVTTPDGAQEDEKAQLSEGNPAATNVAFPRGMDQVLEGMEKWKHVSHPYSMISGLFSPTTSDDALHDEALSSRIAALNMLDLGWDHLGVEIDNGASGSQGIDDVVSACGKVLEGLHYVKNRSPKAKAELLVAAHKTVTSQCRDEPHSAMLLPPIRLKPEGEPMPDFGAEVSGDVPPDPPSTGRTSSADQHERGSEPLGPRQSISPPVSPPPLVPQGATPHSPVTTGTLSPRSRPDSTSVPTALPPSKGTTVNADVLLPILIFSVVKANPVRLVSQLRYIQRYRSRQTSGEESFCLINFLAVVEFLEHVDMHALNLGEADRVMSTHDLSPILLSASDGPSSQASASARIRGRVGQQVGELTTSATKVISGVGGVVDTSFSVLRGLLTVTNDPTHTLSPGDGGRNSSGTTWTSGAPRPGFGLLRRGTGLSIATVAASLPGSSREKTAVEEGQQMLEVPSRPDTARNDTDAEIASRHSASDSGSEEDDGASDAPNVASAMDREGDHDEGSYRDRADTRSIRSFSSMMGRETTEEKKERTRLADRLANMPALSRFTGSNTPPGSRRTSLLSAARPVSSAFPDRIAPPNARFLECTESELRIGEIPGLLSEYRRVVAVLSGFYIMQAIMLKRWSIMESGDRLRWGERGPQTRDPPPS
ncbi:hypothetical protein BS47DRAFT_1389411 [Hydnum rufescens UP504]|uniref:VPS9 domain-containing protein n=1 Tax=Hydnum rufescens UP504 TaxID=1448309 RepID=A0A9P6DXZ7_9AGAM|nr:hypothetical protein BS47DRAFT_1389411 [Hydnum rufescens UP504]